jgi:hypothetical protein
MNKCKIQSTNYLRSNSTRKNYSSESNNESDEPIDDNNIIMKTPQSLVDPLDIDDNDYQNEEDREETENEDDDDDDDDDNSIQFSIVDPKTTETTRQKKSNKKNGKLQQLVK